MDAPDAVLSVRGEGLERRLLLRDRTMAVLRTEYLCDEGFPNSKRFTGAMYGLAAVGSGAVVFDEMKTCPVIE